jgi:HlyD family secretion protein
MNKEEVKLEEVQQGISQQPAQPVEGSLVTKSMHSGVEYVDKCIAFIVNREVDVSKDVIMYSRPPILFGLYIIFIFIFLGGAWAAFAPLDSAAHASGIVVAAADKQRIQHVHGGRVKRIFVKQGETVNEGQALLELQSADASMSYEIALNNYLDLLALQNRLIAQRDNLRSIEFDELLMQNRDNPRIAKLIKVQDNIFNQMAQSRKNTRGVFENEIEKCRKKKRSLLARKTSLGIHLKFTANQLDIQRTLEGEGLSSRTTSEGLLSEKAKCEADLTGASLEVAVIDREIACLELRIKEDLTKRFEETLKELKEVQARLADSRERYNLAKDVLYQQIVTSPMDGIVNDITKNTIIHPQAYVGDITPSYAELIIEARISPQHIDSVHVGQTSKVRFTAFKSRTSPIFTGRIVSISPNIVVEQQPGFSQANASYIARIEMDRDALAKFLSHRKVKLMPGMMADVQVVTGTRTMLRYLLDPVLDQAFNAFKEK